MRASCRLALALAVAAPALAAAGDLPVAGRRIALRARPSDPVHRRATIVLRDPAIAPPFADPASGAVLAIAGAALPGQCRTALSFDPTKWQPIGGNGTLAGYRYDDFTPGAAVRFAVVRPGKVAVRARGPGWPCDLSAVSQAVPVSIALRVGTARYCADFGGDVFGNTTGRFLARRALAPGSCPKTDLTVADLNILHGLFCPAPSGSCRLSERVDLLFQWIAASGCPDVVTLQEVWDPAVPLVTAHLATACPFAYQMAYMRTNGVDEEMILTRYPVLASDKQLLYKNFRKVLYARIDHPLGPVDVFTTHLASGSDGAQNPCTGDCPPACVTAGAATVRQCQGVQVADFVAARHDVPTAAVATGDFNESPGTFVYDQFVDRGWVDTYLAAANPECVPATGVGCTSGRVDDDLSQLESPVSNENERIDYVFLVPPGAGAPCVPAVDLATDTDGDGTATRIFADLPNPFAPVCGPAPDPICWPSDHEGAELDLNCG